MAQLRDIDMWAEKIDQACEKGELSKFRARVLKALLEIPRGRVTSYKYLAQHVSCASSQAIGQAIKFNPWSPEVPCHRVIKTNLSLGGFYGQVSGAQIDRKRKLLKEEGVEFTLEGTLLNSEQLYKFD